MSNDMTNNINDLQKAEQRAAAAEAKVSEAKECCD